MGRHVWRAPRRETKYLGSKCSKSQPVVILAALKGKIFQCSIVVNNRYQDEWTTGLALVHRERHGHLEVESPQARRRQGDRQPITSFFTTAMEIMAGTCLDMNS